MYFPSVPPRVIHRDLKSDNCLIRRNLTAVVADFGLARVVEEGEESEGGRSSAVHAVSPMSQPGIARGDGVPASGFSSAPISPFPPVADAFGASSTSTATFATATTSAGASASYVSTLSLTSTARSVSPTIVTSDGSSMAGSGLAGASIRKGLQESHAILRPRYMSVVGSACK